MLSSEKLKKLPKILDIFGLHLKESTKKEKINNLTNNGRLEIYDENDDKVGFVMLSNCNSNLVIYAVKENYTIKIESMYSKEKGAFQFKYNLYANDKKYDMQGTYKLYKGKREDDVIVKHIFKIYEDYNCIIDCGFNGLQNKFKLYDYKNDQSMCHKNNWLIYTNLINSITIENIRGNVNYVVETNLGEEETVYRYGLNNVEYDYKNDDFKELSIEYNKILNEMDSNYFDFIRRIKEYVELFDENLYNNIIKDVLPKDIYLLKNLLCLDEDHKKENISLIKK